uniref:HBS1-like protein N-terminal domain-containing protein n=1 Tax=Mycena chlorophos TaxID=658473 RepID=A0ABQ0LRT7_MYCCL|nr:predicted protein [Mycena chlorophos]
MVARHRNFNNMAYDDMQDDALSDGGEDYISPEHQALLNDGLDRVRELIGDYGQSGLSDAAIKDVLWDCEFDIDETVQWALEEQERMVQAQERKAPHPTMKDLPPLPPQERELGYGEYSPPFLGPRQPLIQEVVAEVNEVVQRMPLIKLAQPASLESEFEADSPVKRNLSTITERTERTEVSPGWPPRQRYLSLEMPRPPSTITTSYGQAVESGVMDTTINSQDPDLIPVSPSESALHRLSFYEPAPSFPPTEVGPDDDYQDESYPKPSSEAVPPMDTIPDIPDLQSKSSHKVQQQTPTPPQAQSSTASQPAKKSKLAMLASTRASTSSMRSESSRSVASDATASVKTYPHLRPSSQSIKPPSSVASDALSSTSSHVRRAIETAMQMEVHDHTPVTPPPQATPAQSSTPTTTPVKTRPSAPTPSKTAPMPSPSSAPQRPVSKLAQLAQANKVARTPTPEMLSGPPRLPPERTQYLTPIANGSTVTTAITTSYQSLYSLTNPDRTDNGRFVVVPLPEATAATGSNAPSEPKQSKLQMKIKKAQEKPAQQQPAPVEPSPPVVPPMFRATATRTRAEPSAFATVLLDDRSSLGVASDGPVSADGSRRRQRQATPTKIPELFAASGSAFDGPSPDEIIMNARRGTSLAQRTNPTKSVSSRS